MICYDFNCHINKRETPTTCLTNHKGSISHHITSLVIKALGAGTHTHTHTDIADKSNFKKPGASAKGRHTPGLKIEFNWIECVCKKWVHEDCISEIVMDKNGRELIMSILCAINCRVASYVIMIAFFILHLL